ncbi:MAG TPA: protein kinase, partial [Ktedonosporobacter sp.]|nr:protein kinase [Ktedonosporobacter sp.]
MSQASGLLGKRVGGYQLDLEMARNESYCSYLGEQVSTTWPKDYIVFKYWYSRQLAALADQERFQRDAETLQKLRHPSIVPIRGFGVEEDGPYLMTDYEPGESLQHLLQRKAPTLLPLSEALSFISQIGMALSYAHQQGVVHGNLKPQNILFNAGGEALLTDFRLISLERPISEAGTLPLNPTSAYMAPEQLTGQISPASDQYALGCIACELLTGKPEFSPFSMLPSEAPSLQLSQIEQIILKAMAKQPTDRYPSVLAFLMTLNSAGKDALQEGKSPLLANSASAKEDRIGILLHQAEEDRMGNPPDPAKRSTMEQGAFIVPIPPPEPQSHSTPGAAAILPAQPTTNWPRNRLKMNIPPPPPAIQNNALLNNSPLKKLTRAQVISAGLALAVILLSLVALAANLLQFPHPASATTHITSATATTNGTVAAGNTTTAVATVPANPTAGFTGGITIPPITGNQPPSAPPATSAPVTAASAPVVAAPAPATAVCSTPTPTPTPTVTPTLGPGTP